MVYEIDLQSGRTDSIKKSGNMYVRALPFSTSSVALREHVDGINDCQFAVWNLSENTTISMAQPMKYFHDGGINTDGDLYYDSQSYSLLYLPFYYNKMYLLDTGFNLVRTITAIDTISEPDIKIRRSNTEITNGGPAFIINSCGDIADGKIYVCSRLRADNESRAEFSDNNIIDIYDTNTGNYDHSIHIPKNDKSKFEAIAKCGPHLIAESGHTICLYRIE
jgi:hypothetical protein